MEFTSILDLRVSPYKDMSNQTFFRDLNLDQVIDRIAGLWDRDVKRYYYYFPADEECERYRREVLRDVQSRAVYDVLCNFVERMKERREVCEKKAKVREETQKQIWHIVEAGCWCDAMEELEKGLGGCDLTSPGLTAFLEYLREYLGSKAYKDMRESLGRLRELLGGFRLCLTYEDGRLDISEEPTQGKYEDFLDTLFADWKTDSVGSVGEHTKRGLKNPFLAETGLSILEYEVISVFRKKHKDFFRAAESFYETYADYAEDKLLQFAQEITYYLSFCSFEWNMKEKGCVFSVPEVCDSGEMSAQRLYDLALACVNLPANKEVVSNDMSYEKGELFFVLTGPNQGGKTTFARSLGQLVYFTKMGLDVPALSAKVPYFGKILTHFSVEESVETGRGKLKEELVRLAPMMEGRQAGSFVVINELFTTAANYDACIMGKRVLQHFIEQGCRGIYVTHLKELAQEREGVVSLRAMLDERKLQNFKIMRSEAEESAYSINQVNKYHLTYEQLKERLS